MKETERCRRMDCVYRNPNYPQQAWRCNYESVTGRARIAGYKGKKTLPCNCPRYESDGSLPAPVEDWKATALGMWEEGRTDREIADATGQPMAKVTRWRNRLKLEVHPDRKGPPPQFDWKKALTLYRRGYNDKEIAQKLGCGVSTVWRWRFKYELFPQDHGGRKRKGEKK